MSCERCTNCGGCRRVPYLRNPELLFYKIHLNFPVAMLHIFHHLVPSEAKKEVRKNAARLISLYDQFKASFAERMKRLKSGGSFGKADDTDKRLVREMDQIRKKLCGIFGMIIFVPVLARKLGSLAEANTFADRHYVGCDMKIGLGRLSMSYGFLADSLETREILKPIGQKLLPIVHPIGGSVDIGEWRTVEGSWDETKNNIDVSSPHMNYAKPTGYFLDLMNQDVLEGAEPTWELDPTTLHDYDL